MITSSEEFAVSCWPVSGIPEIVPGNDLVQIIAEALEHASAANADRALKDGDVVVITSKIVSKAEGRIVDAEDREEVITAETVRVVATRPRQGGDGVTRIVENRLGMVAAAAGVDSSNTREGTVLLLPVDPDSSARTICRGLRERLGVRIGVVVSDTLGRAWRVGQTDVAIGAAGLSVLNDLRGTVDTAGRRLDATVVAVADEIAAMADLVKGKSSGLPVAIVRGLAAVADAVDTPGARSLVRSSEHDMFRLGTDEAIAEGYERGRREALTRP